MIHSTTIARIDAALRDARRIQRETVKLLRQSRQVCRESQRNGQDAFRAAYPVEAAQEPVQP